MRGWKDGRICMIMTGVVAVVDGACGDEAVGRAVERVWLKRFTARRHHHRGCASGASDARDTRGTRERH